MYDSVEPLIITKRMKIWASSRLVIFFGVSISILVILSKLELELPSIVVGVSFVVWLLTGIFIGYFMYKSFRPTRCKDCKKSIQSGEYCKSCRTNRVRELRNSTDSVTCMVCKEKFSNYCSFESHFTIEHGEPYTFVSGEEQVSMYPDEGFISKNI